MVDPAKPAAAVPPALRITFFGTPEFAVPTLEHLLRSRHEVVGVVTQPDRPRGRGQRETEGPVKRVAAAHQLPVLQPERIQDPGFLERARGWHADLGVVAAYGKILPQTLLQIPPLGMINVHASLLPKYRGAAPIHRAVMAGEPETGITIMRIVKELDAGPMLGTLSYPIGPDDTSEKLERDLAFLGAALLVGVLDDVAAGRTTEVSQDASEATYAPRLNKEEGLIDWTWTAQRIHNKIRGLHPWPHAFTFLDGARYILLTSQTVPPPVPAVGSEAACPGEILVAAGDRLIVRTGEGGSIQLLEIQPEARRPLRAREFLAGHHLHAGQVFGASDDRTESREPAR